MVRLVLVIAVGCVLGAKAGHERHEQILRVTSKAVDNPAVQGVAGSVQAKMSSVLPHRNWREPRRPDIGYLVDVEEILQGPAAALTSVSTSSINRRSSRPWWNQIVLPTSEQIRPRDGSPHHSTARFLGRAKMSGPQLRPDVLRSRPTLTRSGSPRPPPPITGFHARAATVLRPDASGFGHAPGISMLGSLARIP